ncbi:hypothetical protein DPMN_032540 [Dreissena polymorpha]|uniref:Uncharacterized protein n=1 Tax=Dreissena polymorpha TaxID=45954 RepID=A0A9D4M1Y5_DREPO|nr:hypothetical protein DPMN_032540 [Dreissena polymorpha]
MLLAFTRALMATTRALPGLHRHNPSQSGVERDSAWLLTGFNRGGTGKQCDRI